MPATPLTKIVSVKFTVFAVFTALAIFTVSGCAYQTTSQVGESDPQIVTSANDSRDYHYFSLPNQLRVLVISDPTTDKAAASLDVNVGSGSNPASRPGLAHFLEHMLFLGTEKYPTAGEYQAFISEHGGSHNAFTSLEHTNYFFDIDPDFLAPMLDRFAQFFTAPLFNAEYVEREKHAVDSEYQSKRKSDGHRQRDVLKATTNPMHPFSKFYVGSLETLEDRPDASVRDALLAFYDEYYSASRMTLVVVGQAPVAELEQLVREKFSAIPDSKPALAPADAPLFTPGTLPLWVNVEPVKEMRNLVLQFPIPDVQPHYLAKPTGYLGNLLGHEGRGSLLSELKTRGLAEGLSAGLGTAGDGFAMFRIGISLTEAGNAKLDEIIALTFAAIERVADQGIADWRFDEQARLSMLAFEFQEKGGAMHYATRLAGALHDYPYQDVLRAPYAMDHYQPELLREYLAHLNPQNLLATHVAMDLETDQVSPRFDANYSAVKIPDSRIAQWTGNAQAANLHLPDRNPFIPEDLASLDAGMDVEAIPAKIITKPGFELWHKVDASFNTPRANFYFAIRSPIANDTPAHAVLAGLMVRGINEQLNEFSYPARLAGLDYQLYKHLRGVTVRISGYHDKQDILLDKLTGVIRQGEVDADKFALHKAELIRSLKNQSQDTPSSQAWNKLSSLLISPSWDDTALLEAAASISVADLRAYIPQFLEKIEIVTLANGNLSVQQALAMASKLEQVFLADATPQKVARALVAKLDPQARLLYQFDVDHSDSSIVSYFQGNDRSIPTRALFSLANQLIKTPFYHQLRTQQQLGYIVQSAAMPILEAPALGFIIQSPNSSGGELDTHINNFISQFITQLQDMPKDEFERNRQALIIRLTEQDKQLSQRSSRYWHEIDRSNFAFDTRQQLVAAVRAIDKQEFGKLLNEYLVKDRLRHLTIIAQGQLHPSAPDQLGDYREFKDIRVLQEAGRYF